MQQKRVLEISKCPVQYCDGCEYESPSIIVIRIKTIVTRSAQSFDAIPVFFLKPCSSVTIYFGFIFLIQHELHSQ